jgi:hypothetical protein
VCVVIGRIAWLRGPRGEKRPADAIGAAVMVGKIATGEITEKLDPDGKNPAAVGSGAWAARRGPKAYRPGSAGRSQQKLQRPDGAIDVRCILGF